MLYRRRLKRADFPENCSEDSRVFGLFSLLSLNKMTFKSSLFIFFSFCFFVQGLVYGSQFDIRRGFGFYKRYTTAQCYTNGTVHKEVDDCAQSMPPEELKDHVKHFIGFDTDDYEEFKKQYCLTDQDERQPLFNDVIQGSINEKQEKCNNPDKKDECAEILKLHNCIFNLLEGIYPTEYDEKLPF